MSNSSNRRYIAIGLEDANGDVTGPMQVIETLSGFSIKPNGDVKTRDITRASMSQVGGVVGAKNWDVEVPVELKGAGLDQDGITVLAPAIHPLLMACGMAAEAGAMIAVTGLAGMPKLGDELTNSTTPGVVGTVAHVVMGGEAGEAVIWVRDLQTAPVAADELAAGAATATTASIADALVYRPESDRTLHQMTTIHAHLDGQRRIATRALGDLSFDWSAGEFSKAQFSLKGLYQAPTNLPLPNAVYSDIEPPIAQSAGLALGDYPTDTGTIEKLSFKLGAEIAAVPDINSPHGRHSYRITGRKPTGSIDPEVVDLAEFNPFDLWANGGKASIHATLGSVPGERVSLVLPATRMTGISDKERAGSDAYDLSFDVTGIDDDEFYLFFH